VEDQCGGNAEDLFVKIHSSTGGGIEDCLELSFLCCIHFLQTNSRIMPLKWSLPPSFVSVTIRNLFGAEVKELMARQ
jgi:hypothetical protein